MKNRMRVVQLAVALFTAILVMQVASFVAGAETAGPQAITQSGARRPGIYVFYDWSKLSPAKYPIVGGEMIFHWDLIETGPNTYDWSSIDRWLAGITAQGKWGGLRINTYDGQCCGGLAIPQHVLQAHPAAVLTCPGGSAGTTLLGSRLSGRISGADPALRRPVRR